MRSDFFLALSALLLVSTARAQTTAGTTTPPAVEAFHEGQRPEGTSDLSGSTALLLTISSAGAVTNAEVVESLDVRLDEAARLAALQFRFRPAMRGEVPIAARVRYRYVWRVAPIELAPTSDPFVEVEAFGVLEIAICNRNGDAAIGGAWITVRDEAGQIIREDAADEQGRVRFEVAPSTYDVTVTADGFQDFNSAEIVRDQEASELLYRLVANANREAENNAPTISFEATAEAEPPPRDATRRVLEAEILTRIPGTRGDALRAVELLPGVGRPAFGGGNLIIRGSAPGDSQVFLDGNPVPLLYHFGGITSFYNSLLLERIDFIPGNFSARYGRKIGGILEVTPRDPRSDGLHGFVDVNVIDASFMIEGPVAPNLSVAIAARRSYIDFFFANVVPRDLFSVLAAPVYYDYQAIVAWRPTRQHRLRLFVYGSSDELGLVFSRPSDDNPNIRGNLGITTQFHRVQASWLFTESDNFEIDTSFGVGVNDLHFNIGDTIGFNANFVPFNLRSEARWRLTERVRLIAGIDWQYIPLNLTFRGPQLGQGEGQPQDRTATQTSAQVSTSSRSTAYRPGIYLETSLKPWDPFEIVIGVRADYYREIADWSVDPRLTGRLRLNSELVIRGGVGLFSQPPEFQESDRTLGNPNLEPLHAIHVSLGSEFRPTNSGVSVSLDGFYKHLYDRVVSTRGSLPPFFENGGLGRIYGLEVAARLNPGTSIPLFGFLSYTLSRSERLDHAADNWRLFDFDQTHILTAALVWTIGDGWETGATFRLVSGNPLTPITGAVNDTANGTYRPIYGAVNSDRNPMFHRLDVRLEKMIRIGDGRLRIYLDIQNVYNQGNREAVQYNYDYSQTSNINGLPILPSLGIRGEL